MARPWFPTAPALLSLLICLLELAPVVRADVYWNPGDNINRHNAEFAEVARVASTWSPPVNLRRVDCPSRLEDEILYVRDHYASPQTNVSQPGNRLDIFRVEASWLRAFDDSLVDLMPIFGPVLSQFDPRSVAALTVDGKLLAVPSFLDTTLLYYRADLLRQYNLSVPETWDELEHAAKVIQRGQRAAGQSNFWGLMWQGAANEVLTALTYAFIGSFGGGTFINATGDIDIVNNAAKAALARVRGWIFDPAGESITPSVVLNQHLHETKLPFLYERAAFLLDLTHIIGEIHTFQPDGCDIFHCGGRNFSGRATYTQVPGLTPQTRAASPWYWGWAVNKRSPQMDEVMKVVRHLGTRQQQLFKARNGDPPTWRELQDNASATCAGLTEPTICTLPLSNVTLLDRHLPFMGAHYFTLPSRTGDGTSQGVSPLILNGLRNFLLDGSETPEAVVQDWACKIGAVILGNSKLCTPCPVGWERADDLSSCRVCKAGSYGPGGDRCLACVPGKFAEGANSSACEECPQNTFGADVGAVICSECRAGYHTALAGQTACQPCPPGTSWNADFTCSPCVPGSVTAVPGSLQCSPCSAGTFAALAGNTSCDLCRGGTFQAEVGATACSLCGEVLGDSTSDQGSDSADGCICHEGTFMKPGEGCLPCPAGLLCPAGRGPPQQSAGFFGRFVDEDTREVEVFRCASALYCPAAPLSTCAPNRVGLACDACAAGSSPADSGGCDFCSGNSSTPAQIGLLVVGLMVALVVLGRVFLLVSRFQKTSSREVAGVFGVTATFLQCLAAYMEMDVKWIAPFTWLRGVLQLFRLNIDLISPGCTLHVVSPMDRYVASALVVPILLVYLLLLNIALRLCKRQVSFGRFCNGVGKLLLLVFLGILVLSFTPFQCAGNPSGAPTVVLYRSVRCWVGDEDHQVMIAFACLLLTVPITLACVVTHATLQYRRYITMEGGVEFMEKYDFIFTRVRPDCHYFTIVVILRSLLLGFVPATTKRPEAQLVQMIVVVSAYGVLVSRLKPWRSAVANALDSAFAVCLAVVGACGAMLARSELGTVQEVVEDTLWVTLVIAFFGAIALGAFYVKRLALPRKRFAAYLCHPRGSAAVVARLFKEVLSEQLRGNIFLEADEVGKVTCLYSAVVEDTRVLIVLLTRETLRRPWCAVEICAAITHKVKMVLAACDDYEPPTQAFLDNELPNVWSPWQLVEVDRQGCSLASIRAAYQTLVASADENIRLSRHSTRSSETLRKVSVQELVERNSAAVTTGQGRPVVRFPTGGSYAEKVASILALGKATGVRPRMLSGGLAGCTPEFEGGALASAEVIITGRTADAEALGTCHLLQRYLQTGLTKTVATARKAEDIANAPKARYLLVVLTPGILEGRLFAELLDLAASLRQFEAVVPVLAATSFTFPTPEFYEALLAGQVFAGSQGSLERAAEVYQAFFNVFVSDFSPHGSSTLLRVEVSLIMRRLMFWEEQTNAVTASMSAHPLRRHWTSTLSQRVSKIVGGAEGGAGPVEQGVRRDWTRSGSLFGRDSEELEFQGAEEEDEELALGARQGKGGIWKADQKGITQTIADEIVTCRC